MALVTDLVIPIVPLIDFSMFIRVLGCDSMTLDAGSWHTAEKWHGELADRVMNDWRGWEAREFVVQCEQGIGRADEETTIMMGFDRYTSLTSAYVVFLVSRPKLIVALLK